MKILTFRLLSFFLLLLCLGSNGSAQTFTPSPDVLNTALTANLSRWAQSVETNPEYITHNVLSNVRAMNYLALTAYHDPGNTAAVNRLLAHIRNVIAGGNEPTCRGTILGWTDNALAQSLTLAKNTPAVWGQLTPGEINKCDWLMRALTVVGNYFQNYYNEPSVCLMNVFKYGGKRNAPNIVEGYVDIMITAHKYWGGAAAVNQVLSDFNYDTYMATFSSLGFTNIVFGWTYAYGNTTSGRAQMKALMENGGTPPGGGTINGQGVKRPFTFKSYYTPFAEVPYDPFLIYQAMAERMYRHITHNRSNSGQAYMLEGRISPMTGLNGMCNELQGSDGSGERSSVRYAYDGWVNSILTYATLRALNLWGNTAAHQEIDRRIKVGSIDLLYKYKAGYYGRSNGVFRTQTEPAGIDLGYVYVKDIWINYLWSRKDMNLLELMAPTVRESFVNVTLSSGFTNGQFTGEQGLVWHYTQARKGNGQRVKPSDDSLIALSGTNNGNLRTTLAKPLKGLRFKVRARTSSGTPVATIRVNGTSVYTYSRFESTEVEVVHIPNLYALTGQELRIENTGTSELLIDDVELEDASVFIEQRNGNTGSTIKSQLKPRFRLNNQTASAIPYEELTVRYWFTDEDNATFSTFVDAADGMGTGNVLMQDYAVTPGRQGADRYMEYSFTPGAGNLPASGNSGAVHTRIDGNSSDFDEGDDYSYISNTSFIQADKITVYRNGRLIWGKEPGPSSARLAVPQKEEISDDWFVYPNPIKEEFRLGGGDTSHPIGVTVHGMNGQALIRSNTYFQQPIRIETLPAGMYVIEVQQSNIIKHLKLVKP